jgi:signal transduction histidine kinase
MRDITHLKQLESMRQNFFANVSHELRTPMTSIRAFSEILRDTDSLSTDDKTKYSDIIHSEAMRLTRLLDDLLDLSMLENRRVKLNFERSKLSELLDDSATVALSGDDGELNVRRNKPSENIEIYSDVERLRQVFINVIRNAQKYCDAKNPELRIKVAKSDARLTIDFIDNGSGIERKSQEGIFDKFVRVHASKAGGAGLGLSVCREIMTSLGGEIAYLPGQGGAAFRVILPEAATPPVH